MKVLAMGAHPDDVEATCGGTLALYRELGATIFIAIATRGDIGAPTGTRDEIAEMRKQESIDAAGLVGADVIWMGYDDEFLFSTRETRMSFIDAIRRAQPDVMFVLSPNDYHPDHRTAGQIARDARIPASVPLIDSAYPYIDRIPTVFVADTMGGQNFAPEGYVDITSVADIKWEMLARHDSQRKWHAALYPGEFGDFAKHLSRLRGLQAGSDYAEGFQLLHDYPYTGGWELLPNFRHGVAS